MRTNTMLMRLSAGLTEDDIASVSTAERPPSTLYNTATQALVQADCFRRSCREVFRKAGWTAQALRAPRAAVNEIPGPFLLGFRRVAATPAHGGMTCLQEARTPATTVGVGAGPRGYTGVPHAAVPATEIKL